MQSSAAVAPEPEPEPAAAAAAPEPTPTLSRLQRAEKAFATQVSFLTESVATVRDDAAAARNAMYEPSLEFTAEEHGPNHAWQSVPQSGPYHRAVKRHAYDQKVLTSEKERAKYTATELEEMQKLDDALVLEMAKESARNLRRYTPITPFEQELDLIVKIAGLILGVAIFWIIFEAQEDATIWHAACPSTVVNGVPLECNGQGVCGDFSECTCTSPLWSGKGCETISTLCSYDRATNTYCGNRGLCSPFMEFSQVPAPCVWIPATLADPYPVQNGWLHPECVAYLSAKQIEIDAAIGNPARLALIQGAGGVPQCVCNDMWTGPGCTYSGCPMSSDGLVCSGNGNKSVGVFDFTYSAQNTGCHCDAPFNFLQPDVLQLFSDAAKIRIHSQFLAQLSVPFCGDVVVNDGAVFLSKGYIEQNLETTTAFSCFCAEKYFGDACQFGKCPTDLDTGKICSGNGHHGVGFGLSKNSSRCETPLCSVVCAPGAIPCASSTGTFKNAPHKKCVLATHPTAYDASQMCVTPELCSIAKPYRCGDGSCVANPTSANQIPINAPGGSCTLGYTTATLDFTFFNQSRLSRRCDFFAGTTWAECLQLLAGYVAINDTDVTQNPNDPFPSGSFISANPPSQTVWFLLEVRNIFGTAPVPSQMQMGTFVVVYPGVQFQQISTVAYAPQTNLTESFVEFGAFVDPSGAPALTIQAYGEYVQVSPIPFWGVPRQLGASGSNTAPLPQDWINFRLKNVYDGTLLQVQSQNYFVALSAARDATNVSIVFASASALSSASPTSVTLLSACLIDPTGCTFLYNATARTLRNVVTSNYACLFTPNTASATGGWFVSAQSCVVNSTLVAQSGAALQTAEYTLTALPRAAYGSAEAAFAAGSWTPQFQNTTRIPVRWSAASALQLLSLEIVAEDDVTIPCACSPRVAYQTQNQTDLNMQWYTELGRKRSQFSPGDLVVAPFNQYGTFHYERGIVVAPSQIAGGTNTTQESLTAVRVKGYGVLPLGTQNLRYLSNSEFLRGRDDSPLRVFGTRCPQGTLSSIAPLQGAVPESCECDFDTPTSATCACDFITCACSGIATSTPICSCANVLAAAQFETLLGSVLQDSITQCACVAGPPVETFVSQVSAVAAASTATVYVSAQSGALPLVQWFTFSPCADVSPLVVANYSQFAFTEKIDVAISECVSGQNQVVLNETQITAFTSFSFWFFMSWTGNITTTFQPPGFAVRAPIARYDASSNAAQASNAAEFTLDAWSSTLDLPEDPVWLGIFFSEGESQTVDRVFVDVRYAAIPLRNQTTDVVFDVVPVLIELQGKILGDAPTADWYPLGDFVTDVWAPTDSQQFTIELSTKRLPPLTAVRIVAPFPMSIRTLIAYTDQRCDCVFFPAPPYSAFQNQSGALVDKTRARIVQNPPAGALDTFSVIEQLLNRSELMDLSPEAQARCVYKNLCVLTTAEGVSYDASLTPGPCNDLLAFNIPNGVTYSLQNVTTIVSRTVPQFFAQFFLGAAPGDLALLEFPITQAQNNLTNSSMRIFVSYSPSNSTLVPTQPYVDAMFYSMFSVFGRSYYRADDTGRTIWYFILATASIESLTGADFDTVTGFWETVTIQTAQVASASPPPGSTCAPGYDGRNCGPSTRYVAAAPGLTCALEPYQQLVLDDYLRRNGSLPSSQRYLGEILNAGGLVKVFLPPILRNFSEPVSSCPESVCYFPTQRCADGSCAVDCAARTRYDNPGDGCLAADLSAADYVCACAQGFDGTKCEFHSTGAANPYATYPNIDSYLWTECGGPPPLRQQPPFFSGAKRLVPRTSTDVVLENQAFLQWTNPAAQVRDAHWKPRFAPYGERDVVARKLKNGDTIFSDCPYAVRGPFGQLLLLSDCANYDANGLVKFWSVWPTPSGGNVTIVWPNVTAYDDFPLRNSNGECLGDPADAALSNLLYVPCNGLKNTCYPDGTCGCAPGKVTFVLTDQFTLGARYPYATAADGSTIPWTWGAPPNSNWRDFRYAWCAADDCSDGKCPVPFGCFPGTPEKNFLDKLVWCSPPSSGGGIVARNGWCAASQQDCAKNLIVAPLPCSGKGFPYKVDYRPDTYACECGDPISLTQDIGAISGPAELEPNGFGGKACDQYYCSSAFTQTVIWSQFNPRTGAFYTDLGVALLGRWISFCGAASDPLATVIPVGPDPDDAPYWSTCCPGESRLDRCAEIPCRVRGTVQCASSQQCFTSGGTPLVYPCNGHGTPRRDGTCACDSSQDQGVGYVYSADYSVDNCYQVATCPLSRRNGKPCHAIASNDAAEWTDPPDQPSIEFQNEAMLVYMGLGVDNGTYIAWTLDSVTRAARMAQVGLAHVALTYESELGAFAGCVCVFEGEDPANPSGMRPYVTGPGQNFIGFAKAFASPWKFFDLIWTRSGTGVSLPLDNEIFFDYSPPAPVSTAVPINANWTSPRFVTLLRFYGSAPAPFFVQILDVNGANVCPPTQFDKTQTPYAWIDLFCEAIYTEANFAVINPASYLQLCGSGVSDLSVSDQCTAWKKDTCAQIPGAVWIGVDDPTILRGCSPSFAVLTLACCVPAPNGVVSLGTISYLQIRVTGGPLTLQGAQIFGYSETSLSPTIFPNFYQALVSISRGEAPCSARPDYKFIHQMMSDGSRVGGADKTPFLPGEIGSDANVLRQGAQNKRVWSAGFDFCESYGGWFGQIPSGGEAALTFNNAETKLMAQVMQSFRETQNRYPFAWVALRQTARPPVIDITTYIAAACRVDNGCHLPRPSGDTFPYGFYAPASNYQYTTQWDSNVQTWSYFFHTTLAKSAPYLQNTDVFSPPYNAYYLWTNDFSQFSVQMNAFFIQFIVPTLTADVVDYYSTCVGQRNTLCPNGAYYCCMKQTFIYAGIPLARLTSMAVSIYGDNAYFPIYDNYPYVITSMSDFLVFTFGESTTEKWASVNPAYCKIQIYADRTCGASGARFNEFVFVQDQVTLLEYAYATGQPRDAAFTTQQFFAGQPFFPPIWSDGFPVNGYDVTTQTILSFRLTGSNCKVKVTSENQDPAHAFASWEFYVTASTGATFDPFSLTVAPVPVFAFPPTCPYPQYPLGSGCPLNPYLFNFAPFLAKPGDPSLCVNVGGTTVNPQAVYYATPDLVPNNVLSFQFLAQSDAYGAVVSLEAEQFRPASRRPIVDTYDGDVSRANTMGWRDNPFMCMGAKLLVVSQMQKARVAVGADFGIDTYAGGFDWYPYAYSSDTNVFTGVVPSVAQLTSFVAGQQPGVPYGGWCFPGKYGISGVFGYVAPYQNNNLTFCGFQGGSRGYPEWIPVVPWLDPSTGTARLAVCASNEIQIDPLYDPQGALATLIVGNAFTYAPTPSDWRPIPDCRDCQIQQTLVKWTWSANVGPPSGDTFPTDQQVAVSLEYDPATGQTPRTSAALHRSNGNTDYTFAPMILYFVGGRTGIISTPNDGLVYLHRLLDGGVLEWRYYAMGNTIMTTAEFESQWYQASCAGVMGNMGATSGSFGTLLAYPCNIARQTMCILDYTKFAAQNGDVCEPCGDGSRVGGFARPNVTCVQEFADSLTPYAKSVFDLYVSGNLALYAGTQPEDWDATRAFLVQNVSTYLWPNLAPIRKLFNQQVSTQQGSLSKGAVVDTYNPLNLLLPPYDCGWVTSKATGITQRRLAYSSASCDPDLPDVPSVLPLSQLPPSLLGVTQPDDLARFLPRCGTSWRPAKLVTWSEDGPPQTGYQSLFEVVWIDETTGGVSFTTKVNETSLYNTGKAITSFIFQPGAVSWVSGQITIQCLACASGATATLWISPLSPTMAYPATRQVFGVKAIPLNVQNVPVQFSVNATATYLSLGIDFLAPPGSTVTVQSFVLSTDAALAACRQTQAWLPKPGPRHSIVSKAPANVCILTEKQKRQFGALNVGQCFCDAPFTGAACDMPAVATSYGKLAYNGIDGLALTPTGAVVPTTTDPSGEQGLYCWSTSFYGPTKTACGIKERSVGRIMTTVSLRLSSDYGRVYRLDSLSGLDPFVSVPVLSFEWDDLQTAESDAASIGAVLASFVSATELSQVLALTNLTRSPIFLDLEQGLGQPGTGSATGTSDYSWSWTSRSVMFGAPCPSLAACGISMESLPTCSDSLTYPTSGVFTRAYCSALNFGNAAYLGASSACSSNSGGCARDGSLTTYAVSPATTSIYFPATGTYAVEVFSVSVLVAPLAIPGLSCVTSVASVLAPRGGIYYQQQQCTASSPLSSTISFGAVGILEVQAFMTRDVLGFGYTTRVCVYPFGGGVCT